VESPLVAQCLPCGCCPATAAAVAALTDCFTTTHHRPQHAQAYDSKTCPKDSSPLPSGCATGLQFTPAVASLVNKCLAIYRKDPSAAKKVAGC
jgi:hypothetical protein